MRRRTSIQAKWIVCGLLLLSTVINYIDRQTLSVLARTIQDEFGMGDVDYATVVQAFMLAYTLAYLAAGRITDWLGTKRAMVLFISWWSAANILTGTARSALSLGVFRFLLGLGEPGNYTVAPRAVAEWFPPEERGLAIGIYTAGATLGATIAPPVIAFLALHYGWRAAFYLTGLLGFIWVPAWLWVYRVPCRGRPATHSQAPESGENGWASQQARALTKGIWRSVLADPNVWRLTLARLITDPVWYFYLFWFPKFLADARGLSLRELGYVSWVVYLAADAGSIVGGWCSGMLARGGRAPVPARKLTMLLAALLLPVTILVPLAADLKLALAIASLSAFAHLSWQVTLTALATDVFPQRVLATAFGVVAAGSGLGGFLSAGLVGYVVSRFSYVPVFALMGFLHLTAYLALICRVAPRRD